MSAQACRGDACPELRGAKAAAETARREADQFKDRWQRAEQKSLTDPLTGAYNRRALETKFREEAGRARRHGLGLCALFIDVDNFGAFNKQHGQETGDRILTAIVAVIKEGLRAYDSVHRIGGEEFLLLLPETPSPEVASIVAERMRRRIEALELTSHNGNGPLRVTVSIGVATLGPADGLNELIDKANQAERRAKESGKNSTYLFSDKGIVPGDESLAGKRAARQRAEWEDDPPVT